MPKRPEKRPFEVDTVCCVLTAKAIPLLRNWAKCKDTAIRVRVEIQSCDIHYLTENLKAFPVHCIAGLRCQRGLRKGRLKLTQYVVF